ncbi:MAG: hypothetical protein EZS28_006777 [Streblomastix strix]|uniref:Uncharacterized protein n=1 Tax=Streblomastix strix TaxID=222440 RepID=A0A5J4WT54_9EUKA|nr:MAG: hypothetical protein EZS28_006777 [Streblomastix strix]
MLSGVFNVGLNVMWLKRQTRKFLEICWGIPAQVHDSSSYSQPSSLLRTKLALEYQHAIFQSIRMKKIYSVGVENA